MVKNKMRLIHPGGILEEEFLKPLKHTGLTAASLAKAIRVPPNRITAIIKGQRGITGDTAVRLSEFFGNTAKFWMNLQASYDLQLAERSWAGTREPGRRLIPSRRNIRSHSDIAEIRKSWWR